MVLLKFNAEALVGWGIQFRIERVTTQHDFGGLHSKKNEKYMKKHDVDVSITFFHVSLIFHGAWSTKIMLHGYSLEIKLNSLSNECSTRNLNKTTWR